MKANYPILIVVNDQTRSQFGQYTGEILKAEGFNAFQVEMLDAITLSLLKSYAIVILTETRLSVAQAALFRAYVRGGGRLVAFRPEPQMGDLFGVSNTGEWMEEGYLQIDTGTQVGKDLTSVPIQFHGAAHLYQLNGAVPLATLYKNTETPTAFPALVIHSFGQGQALAFSYNLPASIVYTRQGNPAWAGKERDGILGIRAADMFVGWVDSSLNHLNQADEQMHLLAHILEDFSADRRPMPRLWHFPGNLACLVTLTDDGEDSPESDFETHFNDVESQGARMTVYLKGAYIPASTVASWVARGYEVSAHFDDTAEATHPTIERMQTVAFDAVKSHQQAYGLKPKTVRNHWIVWVGWSEQAEIEARCGIGLDCNYYHYDQGSPLGHWLGKPGSFTGSSLPMKFATLDGQILDIYQLLTQLPDEHWREADFYPAFQTLLDRSLDQEGYAFINLNCHTNQWQLWSRKPVMAMLAYAKKRGVPVWNAEQTLHFLSARDAASFEDIRWYGNEMSFTLIEPDPGQDLTIMLPKQISGLAFASLEREGNPQPYATRTIKGRDYIFFSTDQGAAAKPCGAIQFRARYQPSG